MSMNTKILDNLACMTEFASSEFQLCVSTSIKNYLDDVIKPFYLMISVMIQSLTPNRDIIQDDCVVCLEDSHDTLTDCNHSIHFNCLLKSYIASYKSNNIPTCPICRRQLQIVEMDRNLITLLVIFYVFLLIIYLHVVLAKAICLFIKLNFKIVSLCMLGTSVCIFAFMIIRYLFHS